MAQISAFHLCTKEKFEVVYIKVPFPASFCLFLVLFSSQFNYTLERVDVALGEQTRVRRIVGADGSTELWWLLNSFKPSLFQYLI